MKISHNWLKEFIELSETPEIISEILTQTGLEVESLTKVESIRGGLKGLIVGEIMSCEPHPNADKLKLTKVALGEGGLTEIVCGAPNIAVGQKVVVAPVNCMIYPVIGEPFIIKKSKIRGEISNGMICAEDEIGLGNSHDGVLVLDTNEPNGTPISNLFQPETDYVYEIGLTPNRGDAASHLGTARDLKAYFDSALKLPVIIDSTCQKDNPIAVTIEGTSGAIRYSGVTIRGLVVKHSPDWLKWRLKAIGLDSINNIVDVTNYVLHCLGQPLHAFDAKEVGQQILVTHLPENTPFVTLDGKERKLSDQDLMICNESGGMCLAGVFGGLKSGVSTETNAIFLESACFSPSYVRATAQRHGLNTDASFRFERGTDPEITLFALKYAAQLILDVAGGYIASDFIDVYPQPVTPVVINTHFGTFNKLIGIPIPRQRIIAILNSLDITTSTVTEHSFTATIPAYRTDVTREADLVEEVLRIFGINNIDVDEHFSAGYLSEFNEIEPYKMQEKLSHLLSGKGYQEIITNSLTNHKYENDLKLGDLDLVQIINKSSEDLGILKPTPIYTSLESVRFNLNRKQENIRFYEFCKTYGRKNEKYVEKNNLTIFLTGKLNEESWLQEEAPLTFHHLMGDVLDILLKCGLTDATSAPNETAIYAYGMNLLLNGRVVGHIGKLHPKVPAYFDIKAAIFYAELDWDYMMKKASNATSFKHLSKYPEVRRDLSLVIEKSISYDEIKRIAETTERKLLNRINVFSVFEGDQIGAENKAYAIAFYLQDEDKTLNDKQIDKIMSKLIFRFENELNAVIRK
jgi:phenylalanyl-tRNA synthetase beta chain